MKLTRPIETLLACIAAATMLHCSAPNSPPWPSSGGGQPSDPGAPGTTPHAEAKSDAGNAGGNGGGVPGVDGGAGPSTPPLDGDGEVDPPAGPAPTAKSCAGSAGGYISIGADAPIEGNGNVTTETRTVSGFTRIDVEIPIAATVIEGGAFAVTLSADANLQPYVTTDLVGEALVVRATHSMRTASGLKATITIPRLLVARAASASCMSITGVASGTHDLSVHVEGASDLYFSGRVAKMTAAATGASSAELSGAASSIVATSAGASSVDAQAFNVTSAALDASGASNIKATVNDGSVRLAASGASTIDWWGSASVSSETSQAASTITRH